MKILTKTYVKIPTGMNCHASTLVECADGRILCSFFAGSRESNPDVGIYLAESKDGIDWKDPFVIAKVKEEAHWNPVLFRTLKGTLLLFFKVGVSVPTWKTYVIRSNDDGKTWSKAEELVKGDVSGGRGPVKNKPIQLANGKIIAPASIEESIEGKGWRAFVDISEDDGISWRRSGFVPQPSNSPNLVNVIQPTLWHSQGKNIHMLLRTTAGRIYRSDSSDEGESWSALYPIELPNNNSGIDLVKMPDDRLVLVHNPTQPDSSGYGGRHKLAVSLSSDNGFKWETLCLLEDDKELDENGKRIEYSYPAIILKRDGTLLVSYTYRRQSIAVVNFAL